MITKLFPAHLYKHIAMSAFWVSLIVVLFYGFTRLSGNHELKIFVGGFACGLIAVIAILKSVAISRTAKQNKNIHENK